MPTSKKIRKFDDGGSVDAGPKMRAIPEGPVPETAISKRLIPGKDYYKKGGVVKGRKK